MRERGGQPPLHIQQRRAGVGDRRDRLAHEVPWHLVEELLDVEIDQSGRDPGASLTMNWFGY
jgi:hypothetical protein